MLKTQEVDLNTLFQFIDRLLVHSNNAHLKAFDENKNLLQNVLSRLYVMDQKHESDKKTHAVDFNIFNILRYGHYETRLHTPFLVHLLTPDETHQIGNEFLMMFLNRIYSDKFKNGEISNVKIIEEHSTNSLEGRIDIFIRFVFEGEFHFVAVENKINAIDQEKQLQRYFEYLKLQTNKLKNIKLVYLTKYGQLPSIPWSIEPAVFQEASEEGIYIGISHCNDISIIIESNLSLNPAPVVKQTLKQYLQLIRNI